MERKLRKRRPMADLSRYYIDVEEYTKEIVKYINEGKASDRLGELWKLHVDRCSTAACFKGYTYLDEMKGKALLYLVQYSRGFKPDKVLASGKPPNAFKYCTTIIHNAFIQVINKEKQNSILKDTLVKAQQRVLYDLNYLQGRNATEEDY